MRIALIAPFGLRAKGTTHARALPLARALAGRGHEAALFIPPYDSPGDSGRCWHDGGLHIINLALPACGRDGLLWHVRLAGRLLRAVREWRPDVVHIFKPKGPSGLVGTALWAARGRIGKGRSTRISIVVDSDDWEGRGGWNDDPRIGYSRLQRRFFAWQEGYGLSHADAWTVVSACLRERAIRFGAAPERVRILHNGVADIACWTAAAEAAARLAAAVLYTRFVGVCAADTADIWRRVQERLPGARLMVVGRGIAGEEAVLAGLPSISVLGWIEPDELPALFGMMTAAVLPWNDTPRNRARHSVKVLELMAAGLPVVAYAVGELPVTVGDAGSLVPPGDRHAFATVAAELLRDQDRARLLGTAARARIAANYTWDRLVEVALAAYETTSER